MPTLDIIQLDGRDSFVTGVPGLDSVVVEGKVAVFHKNPKLVKTIHRLEIRFCGVTTTKVRPKSLFGTRGKKFKGRWNHVAIPPAVFVGAGAPSLDPLFLKPGEVILFPFSFRIGKHQAAMDMPPSIILPQVGDLRSRGETRYWLEARMGWMRKNNFKASRRVGVEVWMDVLSPSTLSNMLANRPHPTRATHGTESMDRRRSQDSTSTTGSTHRSSMTGLERLRKPSFEDLGVQRRPLSSSSTSDPWNSSEEALIRRKAETAPKLADAAEGIFDRKESTSLDLASTKSLPGTLDIVRLPLLLRLPSQLQTRRLLFRKLVSQEA
ncbi:hypothetical protein BC829DRAFT_3193 [Chytridium lagenaria]|nr:hypothetical protein BC829DRAFT_3193 [Chytridium lagenaria]